MKNTYLLRTVFTCKHCLIGEYFSPDSNKLKFTLEKAVLWIENLN